MGATMEPQGTQHPKNAKKNAHSKKCHKYNTAKSGFLDAFCPQDGTQVSRRKRTEDRNNPKNHQNPSPGLQNGFPGVQNEQKC